MLSKEAADVVTKRRSSWACIGNPKPEQDSLPLVQCGWPALVGWRFLCVCAFDAFLLWSRIAYACPYLRLFVICLTAGKHRRLTRTRNASLPTQASHTPRGARKQPPNQGAIHAASEDTTHTSNHTACHRCSRRRPARYPPRAQQVPSQRTHKLKTRRRGNSPAPKITSRH